MAKIKIKPKAIKPQGAWHIQAALSYVVRRKDRALSVTVAQHDGLWLSQCLSG